MYAVEDNNDFRKLFVLTVETFHYSEIDLAEKLKVSRPTIRRWISGESCPHLFARDSIFQTLIPKGDSNA
jgi:Helix-turn-helix